MWLAYFEMLTVLKNLAGKFRSLFRRPEPVEWTAKRRLVFSTDTHDYYHSVKVYPNGRQFSIGVKVLKNKQTTDGEQKGSGC